MSVKKAIDEGRISAFGPDKLIDRELADRQWLNNTRARASSVQPTVSGAAAGAVGDLLTPAPGEVAPADVEGRQGSAPTAGGEPQQLQADPGYQLSRSRQAAADARTAEIRLAELEGTLIRVDQVKAQLAALLAPVREGLLQIPARLAPLLAPQSDAGRIQTLLEIEIHQVLAPLSKAGAAALPQTGAAA